MGLLTPHTARIGVFHVHCTVVQLYYIKPRRCLSIAEFLGSQSLMLCSYEINICLKILKEQLDVISRYPLRVAIHKSTLQAFV